MCHKFIQLQNRLILFTCLLCRNMVGALFASITSFKLGRITDADSVTRAGETSAVFLHSRLCNMLLWNLVALELCMQQGTSEWKAVCLTTIATDESQHPNGLFDPKQNWLVSYFTRIFLSFYVMFSGFCKLALSSILRVGSRPANWGHEVMEEYSLCVPQQPKPERSLVCWRKTMEPSVSCWVARLQRAASVILK